MLFNLYAAVSHKTNADSSYLAPTKSVLLGCRGHVEIPSSAAVHVTPDVILGDLPIHMESLHAAGLGRGSVQNLIKTPRTVGIEIT